MSVNLLDLIPEQKIKYEETAEGLVVLLKPKFRNKFMVKYVLPRLKKPHFKVNLDEFGSFVWKNCNGNNTVEQIGTLLKKKYSDNIDPVYDRLAVFIQSLARYKFIEYKNYDPEKSVAS